MMTRGSGSPPTPPDTSASPGQNPWPDRACVLSGPGTATLIKSRSSIVTTPTTSTFFGRETLMAQSVKERVYAAAERISAERRPTVSTVRAAAGVSNADATRYLKEWSEERAAAGGVLAATPATLLEAAARLAGTAWAEASVLADERHAAVEAVWVQERKDKDMEVAELVADLDRLTEEKDAAVSALTARVQDLEAQLDAAAGELEAPGPRSGPPQPRPRRR